MADVFEPRKVLANPRQFGRFRDGQRPASTHTVESDQYRAANLQHVISYEFRRWVSENEATLEEFADDESTPARKVSVDRLRRVLRGETMMQLTDLMLFTRNSPTALKAVFEVLERRSDPDTPPALVSPIGLEGVTEFSARTGEKKVNAHDMFTEGDNWTLVNWGVDIGYLTVGTSSLDKMGEIFAGEVG